MMTKMIREHFNLIADAFHLTKPRIPDSFISEEYDRYSQWEEDVEQVANTLQQTNERFDKDRFINACKEGVS